MYPGPKSRIQPQLLMKTMKIKEEQNMAAGQPEKAHILQEIISLLNKGAIWRVPLE